MLPSCIHLGLATADDGYQKYEYLSDILKTAYHTWLDNIRSWPKCSPWTVAGKRNRIQICISNSNPFVVVQFYRSLSFPDFRAQIVETLVTGCGDMGQLAENVTKMLKHDTLGQFNTYIETRGSEVYEESEHVKYLYMSDTASISSSTINYPVIKNLIDSGEFFLFPLNLSTNKFLDKVEFWKVLDLFWGYKSYGTDHTTAFDSRVHPYLTKSEFMESNTGHDVELKMAVYGDCKNLRAVAHMALTKLASLAGTNEDLQTSDEKILYIKTHTPTRQWYTFDSFIHDRSMYNNAMNKFVTVRDREYK